MFAIFILLFSIKAIKMPDEEEQKPIITPQVINPPDLSDNSLNTFEIINRSDAIIKAQLDDKWEPPTDTVRDSTIPQKGRDNKID